MKLDQKNMPPRSDYRLLADLISKYGKDAVHVQSEYDNILRVFKKAGGSWKKIHKGDVQHITLLKTVVKTAYKIGKITKSNLKPPVELKGRG